MDIDNIDGNRYTIVDEDNIFKGWPTGWDIFRQKDSPKMSLEVQKGEKPKNYNQSISVDYTMWPDTADYDQNSPGIIERVYDLDQRGFRSWIEKAFWINVTRVPICVSYLAACAKVKPDSILELGTGGDSAHSTGMFLYWLFSEGSYGGRLVSVDRHPLSHVWPRYRNNKIWQFIQGDSLTVMKAIMNGKVDGVSDEFDMIFIDSSHTYPHTLKELEQAQYMTNAILLDDSTHPEVKQSLDEFLSNHKEWLRVDLASAVTLIERHDYL